MWFQPGNECKRTAGRDSRWQTRSSIGLQGVRMLLRYSWALLELTGYMGAAVSLAGGCKAGKHCAEMDSRRPIHSRLGLEGLATLVRCSWHSVKHTSHAGAAASLAVGCKAGKRWAEMDSRWPIHSRLGLEGLATLVRYSWHSIKSLGVMQRQLQGQLQSLVPD